MENDNAPAPADRFTGALLGLAIGDALALPALGERGDAPIAGYEPLVIAGEQRLPAGQFSAHTELALCLVESLVSGGGFLDPETAGYRFGLVLASDNGFLLDTHTRAAIERASETGDYQAGIATDGSVGPGPAARIAPVGLVHALGRVNGELLVREVMRATLITHSNPDAVNGALAVAYALALVVKRETPPEMLIDEVLAFIDEDATARHLRLALAELRAGSDAASALAAIGAGGSIGESVARACWLFATGYGDIERTLLAAANSGPQAGAVAAIAGALCGAWVGARAIPLPLVEGLDGRAYILMAAPALYRTAQRRAGLFLQLHQRP